MRSREFCVFWMMALLVLVSSFASSSAQTSEKMPTDADPNTDAYYFFRAASSLCPKSLCRGGFVKLVNHIQTPCVKEAKQPECYVAEVDYDGLSLSDVELDKLMQAVEAGQVLFKGRIQSQHAPDLSSTRHFEVTQAWVAASKKLANGTYYQVTNTKIPCPSHPCPAYHEAKLNNVDQRYIDDVDLSPTGASEQQIEEAYKAMADPDGVIVAGIHKTRLGSYGKTQVLVGSRFYLRVIPNPCQPTGCSGQICADTAVMTTCEWRTTYVCYQTAVCEQQADGQCGWTETPELLECLDNARN